MPHSSTVFFIADDGAVRDALSISLSMASLKIEVYSSGNDFLNAYTEDRPGCLLMDLSVKEIESLSVQRALIHQKFTIPIIFLTDFTTQKEALLAIKSGAFSLLEKPVSRTLLLTTINDAMELDCRNRLSFDIDAGTNECSPAAL